jgi:GNAT superfamily N-acetyltransferase
MSAPRGRHARASQRAHARLQSRAMTAHDETRPDDTPLTLRLAALDEIIDLRHANLRQGLPRDTALFEGDELPTSRHVAAAIDGRVVGCATVHLNQWQGQPAWQLRGMAVAPDLRGRGVGQALLAFLEASLRAGSPPVRQLWCNARTPAVGFYERQGWRVVSEVFEIPTAGPHVRMTKLMGD